MHKIKTIAQAVISRLNLSDMQWTLHSLGFLFCKEEGSANIHCSKSSLGQAMPSWRAEVLFEEKEYVLTGQEGGICCPSAASPNWVPSSVPHPTTRVSITPWGAHPCSLTLRAVKVDQLAHLPWSVPTFGGLRLCNVLHEQKPLSVL